MIAYFFIQNCFKCDYEHYSTVVFDNAGISLWRRNVLYELGSYSGYQFAVLWSNLYTERATLTDAAMWMNLK